MFLAGKATSKIECTVFISLCAGTFSLSIFSLIVATFDCCTPTVVFFCSEKLPVGLWRGKGSGEWLMSYTILCSSLSFCSCSCSVMFHGGNCSSSMSDEILFMFCSLWSTCWSCVIWNVLDLFPCVSNWRYHSLPTQEERYGSQYTFRDCAAAHYFVSCSILT